MLFQALWVSEFSDEEVLDWFVSALQNFKGQMHGAGYRNILNSSVFWFVEKLKLALLSKTRMSVQFNTFRFLAAVSQGVPSHSKLFKTDQGWSEKSIFIEEKQF